MNDTEYDESPRRRRFGSQGVEDSLATQSDGELNQEPDLLGKFTSLGSIPPVSTAHADHDEPAPSASDLAFGSVGTSATQPAPTVDSSTDRAGTRGARRPVVAEAPVPISERRKTAGFEQIARSYIQAQGAPDQVKLPASLVKALEQAWRDSLQPDRDREQGGNVVRSYGGDYKLRRGKGDSDDMYEPNPNDVGITETLVGTAHTHPYRKEGQEYGTFSGQDLGNMVNEHESFKLVRSGPYTFMMTRTREFDALVKQYEKRGEELELSKQITQTFDAAYAASKRPFPEKLEAGVLAVCARYNLVYYSGQGAELTRASGARRP